MLDRLSSALAAVVVIATPSLAQDARALRVGHWIQAKGALESSGEFAAGEVEVLEPGSSEAMTGTITGPVEADGDGHRFTLLGRSVRWNAKTVFEDVDPGKLAGTRVKVTGRARADGTFDARRIVKREPGRDRIEGRIDAIQSHGDELELSVQGFGIRVAAQSKLELELALESFRLAPPRLSNDTTPRRDEDERVRGSVRLGADLSLGGIFEWTAENRGNYDLDASRPRDRFENELAARLELVWTPTDSALFLAGYEHNEDWRDEQTKSQLHDRYGRVHQLYGYFRDVAFGFDVQIGRAEIHEPRRWIVHEQLDGLRLIRRWNGLELDVSATTKLSDGSVRDEDTTNLLALLRAGNDKRSFSLWAMDRDNRDVSDDHPRHFGARVLGEWIDGVELWGDLALLRGSLGGKDVSAEAFDVGACWSPDFLGPLRLIGGYAFGAGDSNPLDNDSTTFRQTGFQDNKGKLESATSLRYYGELVDPELANLEVATLGIGWRLEKRTTLTLLAHRFRLDEAADSLYGSNLRAATDGVHDDIGWECDLVLGTKRWRDFQVELVLAAFEPGEAFTGGDTAYMGALQLKYRF